MCGIIGIADVEPVTDGLCLGLMHQQHRGEDAAGVFAYDPEIDEAWFHKGHGLVKSVFSGVTLPDTERWGIGHVRYTTSGSGGTRDIQPLWQKHGDGCLAVAHNGNLVNYVPVRKELEDQGFTFETDCDAEVLLNVLASALPKDAPTYDNLCAAVQAVMQRLTGAYSAVGLHSPSGVFAFRDPWGIRPLLIGMHPQRKAYMFASEVDALAHLGYTLAGEVQPGELCFVDSDSTLHRRQLMECAHGHCSFEYAYFARTNTTFEGMEVYAARTRLGEALARKIVEANIQADVVIPVPSTARTAANALARALNLPYEEGLVKKDHIGRTFIMPTQHIRERAVSQKLSTVDSIFAGKNVILVDDSVVRGTVSKRVTQLARRAKAKSVTFASTFPPIRYPCFYGIDFPQINQLIASGRNAQQICEAIGADALVYNDIETFKDAVGVPDLCTACLSGKYPTKSTGASELQALRELHLIDR